MVCQADTDGLSNPATLRKVVKSVVQEEDRSKNVIIFGLQERKGENVEKRVEEIFQDIGLKPKLQAARVGKVSKEATKRPVKVTLASSSLVYEALCQARKLRHSEKFSKVFVRPDRSEEERARDKALVQELLKGLEQYTQGTRLTMIL